jgi:hypothetical protein
VAWCSLDPTIPCWSATAARPAVFYGSLGAESSAADGVISAEYFSLGAGTDIAPLLQGLDGDLCQAPHWGYVLEGEIVVTYADSEEETCSAGDLYYWPAGHTVRVVEDAELVMFSPRAAHGHVIDHLAAKIAAMAET